MALKFESDKLINDYMKYLNSELDIAFKAWEIEVMNGVSSNFANQMTGRGWYEKKLNAWVGSELKRETDAIKGFLRANTYVIADSFGTGSLMLQDNPALAKYKNSDHWNKDRVGNYITGRKEGTYTDLFGRPRKTSGVFKGKKLENMTFHGFTIKPIPPSKALQNAEKWLYNTYIPRAYKNSLKKMNFSKYLVEV